MLTKQIKLPKFGDDRGMLVAIEAIKDIPFAVKRVYYLCETQAGVRRGFHAHKKLQQLAVCVHGSCEFLMDDGYKQEVVSLTKNDVGLFIPPLVWHEMFNFSSDCILLVLADDLYNESDYIRNYQDFIKYIKEIMR